MGFVLSEMRRFVVSERGLRAKVSALVAQGVQPIIDYAVEHNKRDVRDFEVRSVHTLHAYPNSVHALKLSGANFRVPTIERIVTQAKATRNRIMVDAEDVSVQDAVNDITDDLIMAHGDVVFKTYQMYRKDSLERLGADIRRFHRAGVFLNVKLVRGAYLHQDRSTGMLYDTKDQTDRAYDQAVRLLRKHDREVGEVVFATHNEASYHGFKDLCGPHYHHATLMGFNEPLRWEGTIRRMVHVPFGPLHRTYPYLLRRWYENPIATMR